MRTLGWVAAILLAGAGQAAPVAVGARLKPLANFKTRVAGPAVLIGTARIPLKVVIGQNDLDQPQITSTTLNADTRMLTVRVRNNGDSPSHQALLQASITRMTTTEVPTECHEQPGAWGSSGVSCTPAHPEFGTESGLDVFRLIAPVAPKQTTIVQLPLSEFKGKFLDCSDVKPGSSEAGGCMVGGLGSWVLTVTIYNQGGK